MLNLDRYVISPQSAGQTLMCYLLVDDLIFCRGSRDEEYYVYDAMRATLRKQPGTQHNERYDQLENFQRAWYWVPDRYWKPVRAEIAKWLRDESDWKNPYDSDCRRAIEEGRKKMISVLINNTAPRIGGNIARIFTSLANRRVSGDELTKGLKALDISSEVKIQASYLGGWNIEGCTIESFLRQCAGQPDK